MLINQFTVENVKKIQDPEVLETTRKYMYTELHAYINKKSNGVKERTQFLEVLNMLVTAYEMKAELRQDPVSKPKKQQASKES